LTSAATLLAAAAPQARADVDYPDFASSAGMTLAGAAAQAGTRIQLTPAVASVAGGAWHQTKQSVTELETSFQFQIPTPGGEGGLAFVIQNDSSAPLGGSGCELGYDGIANSLAIEFDTFTDSTCHGQASGDPSGRHVAVHSLGLAANSAGQSAALAASPSAVDFADGAIHLARIRYRNGLLAVYVDDPYQPVLTCSVDLSTLLALDQGKAWVGFTAATGGAWSAHEILSWSYDETPTGSANVPPFAPAITEPAADGAIVNPADVHMESGPFGDPNAGDQHGCTDWEIWNGALTERVWRAPCLTGVEKLHAHLGDGAFEGSHAGRSELLASTSYRLRVRHADQSGDPNTQWSPWSVRAFSTGSVTQVFPLELEDVAASPVPRWVDAASGSAVILQPASPRPRVALRSASGSLLLSIESGDGVTNAIVDFPALASHAPVRVRVEGGALGLTLPATNLEVFDEHCGDHSILLPAFAVAPGASQDLWVSIAGATYQGDASQSSPVFTTPARLLSPPWHARQRGFQVEVVAGGFKLPVNIAFRPGAGPAPGDAFFYVTELHGSVRVVTRDGTVGTFATGLLNFNPTHSFPGSGEQGVTGIVVDPATGDVYVSMLYASASNPNLHFPKVDRFTSTDGGLTAATQSTILDMAGETQGQSHQISNLTIAPDGKLICHMGDGFTASTAQDLDSFRGKILRLNLDGSPAADNPFYDPTDGINSRDYVWAYGVRNPFGGDWRFRDGMQYTVENGPSTDRFAQIVPGRNYKWNGNNNSMNFYALYTWTPAHGPVNLAFVQPEVFGGSGFPASSMGHAFVSESGPTYATGVQALGKRITEWILDANGALVSGPIPFLEYAGTGKATACGLEAGPDGLYMTELYNDAATSNPTIAGARVLRIRYDASGDCNGNGRGDACDIASGASPDANSNAIPDECECAGLSACSSVASSTGAPARISTNGECAVADNAFALSCAPVPDQTGRFIYGTGLVNGGAGTPFYDGLRCVGGGPLQRLPAVTAQGGVASFALDFTALVGPGAITAGSTWHFQYWFRDAAAGGSGANLSDAISVTFR
jgi:glucose/arabinose dehydrogenase